MPASLYHAREQWKTLPEWRTRNSSPAGTSHGPVAATFQTPPSLNASAPSAHHPLSIGGPIPASVGQRVVLTEEGQSSFDERFLQVSRGSVGTISKVAEGLGFRV